MVSSTGGRAVEAGGVEAANEVLAVQPAERADDVGLVFGVVPEEVFALGQFLLGADGCVDFLAGVRVDACVVDLGGEGHGRWGEVLHLLEAQVKGLGLGCKLGHIHFVTAWMRGYEVGYQLLAQAAPTVHIVENPLKVIV